MGKQNYGFEDESIISFNSDINNNRNKSYDQLSVQTTNSSKISNLNHSNQKPSSNIKPTPIQRIEGVTHDETVIEYDSNNDEDSTNEDDRNSKNKKNKGKLVNSKNSNRNSSLVPNLSQSKPQTINKSDDDNDEDDNDLAPNRNLLKTSTGSLNNHQTWFDNNTNTAVIANNNKNNRLNSTQTATSLTGFNNNVNDYYELTTVSLKEFAFKPAPQGTNVKCRVTRDNRGVDRGMYPTYYMHLEKDDGKKVSALSL